LAAIKIKIQ